MAAFKKREIEGVEFDAPTKVTATPAVNETQTQELQDIAASFDVLEKLKATPQKFKKVSETPVEERIRHYKLARANGIACFIDTSGYTIYDKETKSRREVRYCENERSIFKDEQGEFAMRKPIKFKNGELFVEHTDPALIEVLDTHPKNVANGGNLFYKVDKAAAAENEVEDTYMAADAVTMVRKKTLDELMPVVMHLGINTNQTTFEIKKDLLVFAKADPKNFITRFDSPLVKLKAIVQNAADFGILDMKKEGVYWFDTQTLIITNPIGKDARETMAMFLTTDRGLPVLEELQKQLAEVSA